MESSDEEKRLVHAWDFLELWHNKLAQRDGAQRLEEFYAAMFAFLRREGAAEHLLKP